MNKIHLVPKQATPVEPEISREAEIRNRMEMAVRIVKKYLEGVALIYDVNEIELTKHVKDSLEVK